LAAGLEFAHSHAARPCSRLPALLQGPRAVGVVFVGAAEAANRAVTPAPSLVAGGATEFAPAGAPTLGRRLLGRLIRAERGRVRNGDLTCGASAGRARREEVHNHYRAIAGGCAGVARAAAGRGAGFRRVPAGPACEGGLGSWRTRSTGSVRRSGGVGNIPGCSGTDSAAAARCVALSCEDCLDWGAGCRIAFSMRWRATSIRWRM